MVNKSLYIMLSYDVLDGQLNISHWWWGLDNPEKIVDKLPNRQYPISKFVNDIHKLVFYSTCMGNLEKIVSYTFA